MSELAKQLFVINDVSAFADNLTQVKSGQLGFSQFGTILSDDLTAGDENIQFAIRSQLSVPVSTGELKRVAKLAYSAGTAQVSTVDISAAAPAGESKYVKLVDTTLMAQPLRQRTFEGTPAQITAAINADEDMFKDYSASVAGNVITVTAPVNSTFRIVAYDGAVVAYTGGSTAAMAPSNGTPEHVRQLEKDTDAYRGVNVTHDFPVRRPDSQVEAGATYDLVIADFVLSKNDKSGRNAVATERVAIMFACKIDGDPAASNADDLVTEIAKLK